MLATILHEVSITTRAAWGSLCLLEIVELSWADLASILRCIFTSSTDKRAGDLRARGSMSGILEAKFPLLRLTVVPSQFDVAYRVRANSLDCSENLSRALL